MSSNDKVRNFHIFKWFLETRSRHVVTARGVEVIAHIEEPSDRSIVEEFHNIEVNVL